MTAMLGISGYKKHQEHLKDMRLACEALLQINRASYVRIDAAHGLQKGPRKAGERASDSSLSQKRPQHRRCARTQAEHF